VLGGCLDADLKALPANATEEDRQAVRDAWTARHEQVLAVGGLRVISAERHESRRIDNQLRGRSGRQGDPGSSRFYLSLDDHLLRLFASERMIAMLRKLGMGQDDPIEHKLVHRSIENAQKKLEGFHFDVRKQLLDYDNVANQQRQVIYAQRNAFMHADNTEPMILPMIEEVLSHLIDRCIPPNTIEDDWDKEGLLQCLAQDFKMNHHVQAWIDGERALQPEQIKERVVELGYELYREKVAKVGREMMTEFERSLLLQTLDMHWREHLSTIDYLRQGIHLRGYAQKDPRQEFKREAFELFAQMMDELNYEVIKMMFTLEVRQAQDIDDAERARLTEHAYQYQYHHDATEPEVMIPQNRKIGRNELCPCGSGTKYKNCHGKL
jgi:preprotein translocase subunit SecA